MFLKSSSTCLNWANHTATVLEARKNITVIDCRQINDWTLHHHLQLVIPSITVMSDVTEFIRKCQWGNLYTTRFARSEMASDIVLSELR